jgi:ribonucleoside-diphosphate reductase alpha chain
MNSQVQALADYTFVSKYAKYNADLKRRETWNECIDRSRNMHLQKYAGVVAQLQPYLDEAFEAYQNKICVGSQRNLQFAGEAVMRHNARSYNCCGSYVDRLRFFQEAMYNLLCGTGVGFSVQTHHVAKLPELDLREKTEIVTYEIPDSIEGWADSIGVLVSSYFKDSIYPEYQGKVVKFVYKNIREKGALFSHGIGRAPGPDPLRNTHEKIRKLLDECVAAGQTHIKSINAYDIVMHSSDAVLSGGIRRSATICIFSADDEDMMNAKTGNWFVDNPQRGRSNNSALLLKDQTTPEQFKRLIDSTKQFGEPGFYWSDSTEMIPNPCVEIGFYCYDSDGNSGWQFCNLSTINGSKVRTVADFRRAARAATIIGTLQAGYTSFPYLGSVTESIVRREALLGVSITGMMENPKVLLNGNTQREIARELSAVNSEVAAVIGINPAARITCIKPEGSTSCMLGTSSGIHPHHAKRYIRRVQANKMEPPAQYYSNINPRAVEESSWSANNTDVCISFACEVGDSAILKDQIDAIQMLENVKTTQMNWVATGCNKQLGTQPWLSHNVSNTVVVKPEEWDAVEHYIYDNRNYFAGVSLIGSSGDKDYTQAPFTEVFTPEEIVKIYGNASLFASGIIEEAMMVYGDLWKACATALGYGENLDEKKLLEHEELHRQQKINWIARVKKFAKKYYANDTKRVTYLLKDVYNWKLWYDIVKEHKKVDYTELFEGSNTTSGTQEIACAGGACLI